MLVNGTAGGAQLMVQGVYGAYFTKLNIMWSRNVRSGTRLRHHPIIEVILVSPCDVYR
jgi:hypothetical protein